MPEPTLPARPAATFVRGAVAMALRRRPPFALCYHGVAPSPDGGDPYGLFISPQTFAAQLDAILRAGYRLVTMSELWDAMATGGRAAGRGLGAVTFDDGLAESLDVAAELLAARGARATAFVSSALLGGRHPDVPDARIVDAAELARLAASVFEIGTHGAGHVDLATVAPAVVREELRTSRAVLEDVLGKPVAGMAYPFGSYTPDVIAAARETGYRYGCGCGGSGPWRPFELPREGVLPSTTAFRLQAKTAGVYGPLHRVLVRAARPG